MMVNDTLEHDLGQLKEELLKMGRLLEEQVYKAVKALAEKNIDMAHEVITHDDVIDRMELEIEQKCYSLIARRQPMAGDLRFIATTLRIIVDIERMADHAEDISIMCIDLYEQPYIKPLIDIPRMAAIVSDMVERAINALIKGDTELAMSLIPLEREIDGLYDQVFNELLIYMMKDPKNIPQATAFLLVAGHLERIADHATNIAEMVIYAVEARRIDLNKIAREK